MGRMVFCPTLALVAALPLMAGAMAAPDMQPDKPIILAQQCEARVGPFATQGTANQRIYDARSQGYDTSNGTFACWDEYGRRGYCFNVYRC
jgi:hypothetical protein